MATTPEVMLSPKATNFVAANCGAFTTVTAKVHDATCCFASRAVHVALVVPTGNADGVQLVAQSVKPLAMKASGDTAHPVPDKPDVDPRGNNVLTLQLNTSRDDVSVLRHIERILMDYPGETPVHLSMRGQNGTTVRIIVHPRYFVNEDPELLEQLEPWL